MHSSALRYVQEAVGEGHRWCYVIEFGSRDVNGTVRDVIDAEIYIGVDIATGPGVNVVADAAEWVSPAPADLVVCCETLEHTPRVEDIVRNAARNLEPGGVFVVTCAADPRAPHSAVDGGPLRLGEYYANVSAEDMRAYCERAGLEVEDLRTVVLPVHGGDLYLTAVKKSA